MALNVANLQQLASGMPRELQGSMGPAFRAQDKLNADINQQISALTTVGPWQSPTYLNSWTDFGSQMGRFRKLAIGLVVLEGGIKGGASSSTAFVLPDGYRPDQQLNFPVEANGAFGRVIVGADGTVVIFGTSTAYISLNVSFMAA